MKNCLALIVCACLVGACTMEPGPKQAEDPRAVKYYFEATWASVLETMAELRLPIMDMDKAARIITTDWISFKNQDNETGYCACGTTKFPMVDVDRRGKFQIFVTGKENSQEVRVSAVFEKVSQYKDIVENTPCASTGKLEAEFSRRVSKKFK